jgi:serine/threonine protein kinase
MERFAHRAPREDGVTQVGEGQPVAQKEHGAGDRPSVGEVLAERYRLEEHVNDDSAGRQVWRGVDIMLLRPIAVVLRSPGGDAAQEMLAAAVTASRVVHPNLIGVYDAIDEVDRAYVVREWVEGLSLRQLVEGGGPLDPNRAIATAHAVAEAVAALHASGMAHGNVHPGTVLLANDGRVVLTDARAGSATNDGDVRAIGGVLYYALTELWPQREAGVTALPDAVRDDDGVLAAPRQVRAGVPTPIDDLVSNLLNDSATLPSADVLAAELDRLDVGAEERSYGALRFTDTLPEPARQVSRKMVYGVAVAVLVAAAALTIGAKALTTPQSPTTSTSGSPSSASPTTTTSTPAGAEPTDLKLTGSQVHLYDPNGDASAADGLAKAVDGKNTTGWKTEHYNQNFGSGGVKPGMGLWVDLGAPQTVADVTIVLSNNGASVKLLGGSASPGANSMNSFSQIGGSLEEFNGTNMVFSDFGNQPRFRYLLLWITGMPRDSNDSQQRYQIGVQEITVRVK